MKATTALQVRALVGRLRNAAKLVTSPILYARLNNIIAQGETRVKDLEKQESQGSLSRIATTTSVWCFT